MRILIDTNIVIPLEDSSVLLKPKFAEVTRIANERHHTLLIHPGSLEDIKRDRDLNRREIMLSRLRKYPLLENPPTFSESTLVSMGISETNDNDAVDNRLLAATYNNAVAILITEDKRIHSKAARLHISDRVFSIGDAAHFLSNLGRRESISLPNISEIPIHSIGVSGQFFDSLREDYYGFDEWYNRSASAGRKAWAYLEDHGVLGAIAVYKEEHDPIVTADNRAIRGDVLKLCTLKVAETTRGRKVGELLLKAAFHYSTKNDLEHIYCTVRRGKHDSLRDLLRDFGFFEFGVNDNNDDVFLKEHPKEPPIIDIDGLEYNRRYYPHVKIEGASKYVVPIRPEYHMILFPEFQETKPQLTLFAPPENIPGNAIKQAYLSHARVRPNVPGSLLLFYRSSDLQAITSLGVVEKVVVSQDADEIVTLVTNRTVYTREQIELLAQKPVTVFLFRLVGHFQNSISFDWLTETGVVNGNIQTIRKLDDSKFERIAETWGIPGRIVANSPNLR